MGQTGAGIAFTLSLGNIWQPEATTAPVAAEFQSLDELVSLYA
jgi:hypothetical protein